MFITCATEPIEKDGIKGYSKIHLEIFADGFLDEEALEDPALRKIIDNMLRVTASLITNLLHFYKKNPILIIYTAGSVVKDLYGKNEYFRSIAREIPEKNKES